MKVKEKIILISVMAVPLLLIFGWIFYNSITDKRTGKEVYLDLIANENCEGIVDTIYREQMNHNIMILKTNKCEFQVEAEWENKFKIGDSISKRKGELIVKHYRNNKLLESLDYQKLDKK